MGCNDGAAELDARHMDAGEPADSSLARFVKMAATYWRFGEGQIQLPKLPLF